MLGVDEDRKISRLWIELELHDDESAPWTLVPKNLVLVRGAVRRTAEGFADEPAPIRRDAAGEIVVAPHGVRRTWARFTAVTLDENVQGPSGARSSIPGRLELAVDDAPAVALVDPARADPVWVADDDPARLTMGAVGLATGFGSLAGRSDATMSMEVSAGISQRLGELDLGLLGLTRVGFEITEPISGTGSEDIGGGYMFYGGGPAVGYTLRAGPFLLRPSLAWLVGRAYHIHAYHPADFATTPHALVAELQFGERRHYLYPFVARDSAFTGGMYVRATLTLGTFSTFSEPAMFLLSFGVGGRLGG